MTNWQLNCKGEGRQAGAFALFDNQKINLNRASAADLKRIPRVSKRLAQAIIDKRQKIGRFHDLEELDEIKGVGEKTLARFKSFTFIE